MSTSELTRMSIADFRERGYLQEINRQYLHPLGVSLEVEEDDAGAEAFVVIDRREDPEGIVFDWDQIDADKSTALQREWAERVEARRQALGFMVQPRR